jgi:hypothetical protein
MTWTGFFARYVLIALAALVIGIAINLAMRGGLGELKVFDPLVYLVLAGYGSFHIVALSVARILSLILSLIFSIRVRAILPLSLAVIGFLTSIYLESPREVGGISLFVICWGSLVLIALDNAWSVNRQHRSEAPSPFENPVS